MPPSPNSSELVRESLAAQKEEYQELSETWRQLETKAQGTIAVSGVFLAAAFAFVRQLTASASIFERVLLIVGIALLVLSVSLSIWALRIRRVPKAPIGDAIDRLVSNLEQRGEQISQDRLANLVHEQTRMWRRTNESVQVANNGKAKRVFAAQCLLLSAILVVAVVTIVKITFFGDANAN